MDYLNATLDITYGLKNPSEVFVFTQINASSSSSLHQQRPLRLQPEASHSRPVPGPPQRQRLATRPPKPLETTWTPLISLPSSDSNKEASSWIVKEVPNISVPSRGLNKKTSSPQAEIEPINFYSPGVRKIPSWSSNTSWHPENAQRALGALLDQVVSRDLASKDAAVKHAQHVPPKHRRKKFYGREHIFQDRVGSRLIDRPSH